MNSELSRGLATEYLKRIADVLEAWAGGHFNYYPPHDPGDYSPSKPVKIGPQPGTTATAPGHPHGISVAQLHVGGIERAPAETLTDIAWIMDRAERADTVALRWEAVKSLIQCVRECAMEAEIGHELSGFRVTLLQRYGLTDGSDPAFCNPPKYPKPDTGDVTPF